MVDFKGSPHQMAFAFAVGVFIGIVPGTGLIAAAAAAALLRLNVPVVLAGACLTNPLTMPLIYGAGYAIGHRVLGEITGLGRVARLLLHTITGTILLGVVMAVVSYLSMFGIVFLIRCFRKKEPPDC